MAELSDHEDAAGIISAHTSFAVQAIRLSVPRIADLRMRHDAYLHLAKVCQRFADSVQQELRGTVPLRRPASTDRFRAATEELKAAMPNATAPTTRMSTEMLARIIDEEESKP